MIITAKANGDILNIKPSVFYQGSTEANKIYLIAPFAISSSVSVSFTLPNTTDIAATLMIPSTAISDTLNTWVYDVPVALTQYVGIVKVNISITTPSGTTITLNRCQFEVKRGDEVVLPDEPEADVYATIVQALADIYANFINKVDTTYTDSENEVTQGIVNSQIGLKLYKTVGDVTVTFEITENGVEIDGIDIKEQVLNAVSTSNEAKSIAENAESVANGIDAKATEALSNSEYAVEMADEAKATADGIDAKATEALANSEDAVDTADEAKAIALSKTNNKSFDTYAEMIAYVSDVVNKEKHTVGSEFFIAEDYYSEYWVKEVLTTPNESGYYYEIEENEATVLSVNNKKGIVVLKTDDISDTDQTNKWSTASEKEKVSKIVIDGDGKKALLNDGTYGEVGTVDTVNNVLPDENKNITITADDISDTSTTNKFATAEELAQISTNAEDIIDLQDYKVDKEFSSDYGTTEGVVRTWKSDTNTYRVGDGTLNDGNGYTGTATEVTISKYYDDGTHGIAPVTEIGQFAFSGKSFITKINLPNTITSITKESFYGCSNLTEINIPEEANFSGDTQFQSCSDLISINIPKTTSQISAYMFQYCSSLKDIILPETIISIGNSAFRQCENLKSMTLFSINPPILSSDAIETLTDTIFYVPYASLTAYKTAANWSTYADRIFPIPEGEWITEDLATKQPLLETKTEKSYYYTENGEILSGVISVGGGSSAASIYLTADTSTTDATYKKLSYTLPSTQTILSQTVNNSTALFGTYIFDTPIKTSQIDAGKWSFSLYGYVSNTFGTNTYVVTVFKRDTSGAETNLFTVESSDINVTTASLKLIDSFQNGYITNTTDKLGCRISAKTTSTNNRTLYLYVGDGTPSYINSSLQLRHEQLRGLNDDSNYLHITSTEKAKYDDCAELSKANTFTGINTFNNDVNINGNIVQNGSAYETHAEQVYTTKDEIILRDGAVSALATGTMAKITAKLYDGTNDGVLGFDNTGVAKVGDVGSEQAIATREDSPIDDGVARWDNSTYKFVTETPDTIPTDSSAKLVTSGGVKTALDLKFDKTGGTITGDTTFNAYMKILGTAADRHLLTRGIGGASTDGLTSDDLYINYGTSYGAKFGSSGQGSLKTDGGANFAVRPTVGAESLAYSSEVALKATTASYTATLPYTSWTGASAPYSKAVTVTGILSTDKPDFDLNLSSATYANIPTIQSAWFNVYKWVASANTITFYSHEIPSIDIPLLIKVVR